MIIRTKCGFTTTKVVKIDASGDTPEITLFFVMNYCLWAIAVRAKAKPETIVSCSSTLVAEDIAPGYSVGLTWSLCMARGNTGS